ncbi:hypothetical protein RUM44_006705 [Polyplax serrata]|uniref:Uncharacterized protein n=1 Tax=Polyplax serrata TaxID=468196 RepID=A0ABR1AIV7_POLSC
MQNRRSTWLGTNRQDKLDLNYNGEQIEETPPLEFLGTPKMRQRRAPNVSKTEKKTEWSPEVQEYDSNDENHVENT